MFLAVQQYDGDTREAAAAAIDAAIHDVINTAERVV